MTETELVEEALKPGVSLKSLAASVGLSAGTIRNRILKAGRYQEYLAKAKRHPKHRRNPILDAEIIHMLLEGMAFREVAERLSVSVQLVFDAAYLSGRYDEIAASHRMLKKKAVPINTSRAASFVALGWLGVPSTKTYETC